MYMNILCRRLRDLSSGGSSKLIKLEKIIGTMGSDELDVRIWSPGPQQANSETGRNISEVGFFLLEVESQR